MILYLGVIGYCVVWNSEYAVLDAIAVVALAAGIVLTMSRCSALSGKFNNKCVCILGEMTIPIFLNHYYYVANAKEIGALLGIDNIDVSKLICIVLSVVTSIIVYLFAKVLQSKIGK